MTASDDARQAISAAALGPPSAIEAVFAVAMPDGRTIAQWLDEVERGGVRADDPQGFPMPDRSRGVRADELDQRARDLLLWGEHYYTTTEAPMPADRVTVTFDISGDTEAVHAALAELEHARSAWLTIVDGGSGADRLVAARGLDEFTMVARRHAV